MGKDNVVELSANGKIIFPERYVDAAKSPWYEHPAFKGVFLKDFITAADKRCIQLPRCKDNERVSGWRAFS